MRGSTKTPGATATVNQLLPLLHIPSFPVGRLYGHVRCRRSNDTPVMQLHTFGVGSAFADDFNKMMVGQGKALVSSQQSQEAKKVAALCEAGLALYNQKQYDEAEEAWKSALQISQNDTRTLMHYSVFLRDVRGKPDVAEQLLQQATGDGDWHQYITPMTEQNREAELWRKPVVIALGPPQLTPSHVSIPYLMLFVARALAAVVACQGHEEDGTHQEYGAEPRPVLCAQDPEEAGREARVR